MKHHPELRAAIARALARARARRQRATVYDLFAALVEAPDVHLMLHQTGADADALSAGLDSAAGVAIARGPISRLWRRLAPDPAFGAVLALAELSRSGTTDDLRPVDVVAAAFDSGEHVLVTLLETAGVSRAAVWRWRAEDRFGEEGMRGSVGGRPPGALLAARRRLAWSVVPADDASSTDAVIAACAAAAVAVWVGYQRHAAGASAMWTPFGIPGVAWYGLGLLALAWVIHRVSGTAAGFRCVLAPIAGWVPLALAAGIAIQWAPERTQRPLFVLLAAAGLIHVARLLAAVGVGRPAPAILAAAGFAAAFSWGSDQFFITPTLWFPAGDRDEERAWSDTERLIFAQADRIDAAVAQVRASDPGRPGVFFVGFAGTAHEKVFAEEAKTAERVIAERYAAAGRSLLLVNDRRDTETRPLATVSGLRRALAGLAGRMDVSRDVLFLFLTSHGSAEALSVSGTAWSLEQLEPKALRKILDDSGIRWQVIVISACHSGAFIPALAREQTAVFTSAAADRTSFGCSDDRDMTEFGRAFIRDALPAAPSLAEAFERAKEALADEERRRYSAESLPQSSIGTAIAKHWARIEALHPPTARE